MENSVKSAQTSKKGILYLILFISIFLIGIGSVLTGFLVNKHLKDTYVPKTYYVEANGSFSSKNKYFTVNGEEYIKATPASLGLYIVNSENSDEYILSTEEKFESSKYYSYDAVENKYNEVSANDLELVISKQTKYKPAAYIYILEIVGAAIFLLSFGYLYAFLQIKFNIRKMNVKQMAVIGIFGALSVILYYFAKFNVPFFPSWLDIQFSDIPALLVSFMYGPVSGVLVIIVRFFCKLPGTSTVGVGELADVIIGVTLCLVSGLIYKKHRSLKGALCAMAIGMLSATFAATISNWLILIPAYKGIAGYPQSVLTGTMDTIISGGKGVVTDKNFMLYYLFIGVVPFNLFRYTLVFVITLILYKRLQLLIIHFVGEFKEPVVKKDEEPKLEPIEECSNNHPENQ